MFASLMRHCPSILIRFQLPVQFLHPSPSSVLILMMLAVADSGELMVALVATLTLYIPLLRWEDTHPASPVCRLGARSAYAAENLCSVMRENSCWMVFLTSCCWPTCWAMLARGSGAIAGAGLVADGVEGADGELCVLREAGAEDDDVVLVVGVAPVTTGAASSRA